MGNESSTSNNGHSSQIRLFILVLMFAAVMNFAKDVNQLRVLTQTAHSYASSWIQMGSTLYASNSVAQPSTCQVSQKQQSDEYRWVGEIATVRGFEIPDENNSKIEPVLVLDANSRKARHNKPIELEMKDIHNFKGFAFNSDEFRPVMPESGSDREMANDDNSNAAEADDEDGKSIIPFEQSRIYKPVDARTLNAVFTAVAAPRSTSETYSFSVKVPPELPARIERVVRQHSGAQLPERDRELLMRALQNNVRFKKVS